MKYYDDDDVPDDDDDELDEAVLDEPEGEAPIEPSSPPWEAPFFVVVFPLPQANPAAALDAFRRSSGPRRVASVRPSAEAVLAAALGDDGDVAAKKPAAPTVALGDMDKMFGCSRR